MKTINKAFGLLLCLIVCITSVNVSADWFYKAATAESYYFDMLCGLNLLPEDLAGKKPEDAVTRLDFARMAAFVLCGSVPEGNYTDEIAFDDVNRYTEGYSSLQYLKSMGIITGNNRRFEPDEQITLQDACTILVRMLNYEKPAQVKGGYPIGYTTVASELKIISGDEMNYSAVWAMLSKALLTGVMKEYKVSSNGDKTYDDSENLLWVNHKTAYIDGIMTENRQTSLLAEKSTVNDRITVGGTVVWCDNPDSDKLLGMKVRAFVKENQGGEYETVFVTPVPGKSEVTDISFDDDYKIDGNTVTLYDEQSNKESLYITENFDVILNGLAYSGFNSVSDVFSGYADDNGKRVPFDSIKLIDSEGDGEYDILSVIATKSIVADMVDASNKTVIDKISGEVYEFDAGDIYLDIINSDGSAGSFDSISADTVISIAAGQGNKKLYTLYLSDNIISSTVRTKESGGKISVDNKEYTVDDDYADEIVVGKRQKLYASYAGKIIYVGSDADSRYIIGIIAGLDKNPGIDETMVMKLYNGSGFTVYTLADKLKLNDKAVNLSDAAERAAFKAKVTVNNIVGVRRNNDGKVNNIVYPDGSSDGFFKSISTSRPDNFQYAAGYINGEMAFGKASVIYSVPNGTETDENDYSTVAYTNFGDRIIHKNYKCYAVSDYQIPTIDYMVIEDYGSAEIGEGSFLSIVTGFGSALDNDGMECKTVEMFSNGRETTYLLNDDGLISKYDINIGDVVAFSQNGSGKITGFATRLRADRKKGSCAENIPILIAVEKENNMTSHNSAGRMTYGIIQGSSDSYVSYLTRPMQSDGTGSTEQSLFIVPTSSRQPAVVYNKEKKEARVAARADMLPGREIMAFTSQGATRNIFIFE